MERDLIARIQRLAEAPIKDHSVLVSIGDDCAVLAPSPDHHLIITTDTLVESIHFDLDYFNPWHLGRKTAEVNLSDAAAMGGNPRWAFLNLAVRSGLTDRFWDSFSKGLLSRLSEYGVSLVGGDTVSAPDRLSLSLTLIGELKEPPFVPIFSSFSAKTFSARDINESSDFSWSLSTFIRKSMTSTLSNRLISSQL